MGEIADMMLEGTLCEGCGEYIGEGDGYPQYCSVQCARNRGADISQVVDDDRPAKKKKQWRGDNDKRNKIDRWFFYNNAKLKGNGPALDVWLAETDFDSFKKGKRDSTGKLLVFLFNGDDAVAAVRCEPQYYQAALDKIKALVPG